MESAIFPVKSLVVVLIFLPSLFLKHWYVVTGRAFVVLGLKDSTAKAAKS